MPFVPDIQFFNSMSSTQTILLGFYLFFTFSPAVNAKVVCVRPPSSSWGILTRGAQGIKCITCGHSCGHAKFLFDSLESESCPDFISEFVDKCQQGTIKNIKILS